MDADSLLTRIGLFDGEWYRSRNPDVDLSGLPPLEHYLLLGLALGRAPGPGFDPESYLDVYPDAAASGLPAILHYLRHGIAELRIPGLVEAPRLAAARHHLRWLAQHPPPHRVKRSYAAFDHGSEERFLRAVDAAWTADRLRIEAMTASIVMPVFNRRTTVGPAIESVLAQTHVNWELLVVDDGSSDGTAAAVEPYLRDPRVRLLRQPERGGVASARNLGLERVRGEMVFYLDSDNRWIPHHLRSMLTYARCAELEFAYCGLAVEDDVGRIEAYRGDHFSWEQCHQGNYVDLNVCCHTTTLYRRLGGFDASLRRMVDWDLVLRYARESRPAFAPFIGCHYRNASSDPSRISNSEPYAFRRIIQTRHDPLAADAGTVALRFAIKIPAPGDKREQWGDFHYAESLADALRALGQRVRIDFLEEWYAHKRHADDVVIVLRGLSQYRPHPEHVNVLWNISHPDQVGLEEYEQYQLVYVASHSWAEFLSHVPLRTPAKPLLQCTDPGRFSMQANPPAEPAQVLFVGNSRARRRPVVDWAIEADLPLQVHGTRWAAFIPAHHIAGEHIPNTALAGHYRHAGVVLNDHWPSMADFGFVSNRLFDIVAAGGIAVSDHVPSIQRVFGNAVTEVDSASALAEAVARHDAQPVAPAQRRARSAWILRKHTFPRRAEAIWNDVARFLGLPADPGGTTEVGPPSEFGRPRIGLLLQTGARGPTSSAFIRLIAPLTTELAAGQLHIQILDGISDPALADCDACVVQRVAVPAVSQARELAAALGARGTPLYVDTDDAFGDLPESHPEQEVYREKDEALRWLMQHARRVWFATEALMSMYPSCAGTVVANGLDPRLWRDYREAPRKAPAAGKPLQLLYMGTPTHDADFTIALDALDALWSRRPGSFRLTLVRAVRHPPSRPWIKQCTPPQAVRNYPRFARWLRGQGPFHVGLAPLVDSGFNSAKSDIKILDYCALGLVSVVSDTVAYRATAPGTGFVVRCSNDPVSWCTALERLIERPQDLPALGNQARQYLWEQRTATAAARTLLEELGLAAGAPANQDVPPA